MIMTRRKDDTPSSYKGGYKRPSLSFSKPANDNRSPLKSKLISLVLVAIGAGSVVLLFVL